MGIKIKVGIIMIIIASLGIGMTGCYKKLSEYDCIWISEDNCIQLDSVTGNVILNIDGVDQSRRITALSDSGQTDWFFSYYYYSESSTESSSTIGTEEMVDTSSSINEDDSECYGSTIWEVITNIRNGKLYLTVEKDYVSDWEGKTIVLEPKAREE